MKLMTRIMILLCTCVAAAPMHAQENPDSTGTACVPVRTLDRDSLAFGPGEKMSFILHYQWGAVNSDVGYADVTLDTVRFNGQEAFLCKAYGKTTKLFDLFFKVREDFRSWFACDGLRPLKFTRDTHEGKYEAGNTYLYDWNPSDPHIDAEVFTSKKGQTSHVLPLTPCTFDLPSLFFFARNMDFDVVEPGRKYPMTFAIDEEVCNVYFILYGRETIKVKGFGTVNAIKFGAKLLEGEVFKGEEDMLIWVTDDQNRLPVYFEAPLFVGLATGRMTECDGLKYPLTSLIKKDYGKKK